MEKLPDEASKEHYLPLVRWRRRGCGAFLRQDLSRFISWQITPLALTKAVTDPDRAAARRAFDAMMQMKKIDIAAIEAAHRG
jgi:hypothetical protein